MGEEDESGYGVRVSWVYGVEEEEDEGDGEGNAPGVLECDSSALLEECSWFTSSGIFLLGSMLVSIYALEVNAIY